MSSAPKITVDVQWDNAWLFVSESVSVCVHVSVCLCLFVCLSVCSCRDFYVAAESGALKHDHMSLLPCSIEVGILLMRLSTAACWCVLLGPSTTTCAEDLFTNTPSSGHPMQMCIQLMSDSASESVIASCLCRQVH